MKRHIFISLHFLAAATIAALVFASCTPTTPDYCSIRDFNSDYDLNRIDHNVITPCEELSLSDVLGIALARNLDMQLQEIENCVQSQTYVAEKLSQLQHLRVNGDYSERNNSPAYLQDNIDTGASPEPTVSTSRTTRTLEVTPAFNLIDFGLTYVKTRQEKNRYLMLCQRHLRAKQNLVLDVYRAYYRVIVAKRAKEKAEVLIVKLEKRQEELERQVEEQVVSEMRGLLNENRLLDMRTRLAAFENEYRSGKTELSALMGYRPGRPFEVQDVTMERLAVSPSNPDCLDDTALHYRPELISQDIQYYVDCDEVRAQLIRMFPNAELFYSWWSNEDRFLVNNQWIEVGATVSWDLLQLPSKYNRAVARQYQADLEWHKRLSMSMGVLTQVRLAYINIDEALSQYNLSLELKRVKDRQLEVSQLLESAGQLDIDDIIAFEVEALFAEVNALKNYSNSQIALEQLGNAIGRPLYFSMPGQSTLSTCLQNACSYDIACDPGVEVRRTSLTSPAEPLIPEDSDIVYYEDFLKKRAEEEELAKSSSKELSKEQKLALQESKKQALNKLSKKRGNKHPSVLQARKRILEKLSASQKHRREGSIEQILAPNRRQAQLKLPAPSPRNVADAESASFDESLDGLLRQGARELLHEAILQQLLQYPSANRSPT